MQKYPVLRTVLCALLACVLLLAGATSAWAVEPGFTVFHGDRESKQIAITVDDCFNEAYISMLLDLCEQYDIPITFFFIGRAIAPEERELWQRAVDLGCELGNHTYNHVSLPDQDDERITWELQKAQTVLDEVLGYHYSMRVMRPPYGKLTSQPDRISDRRVVNAIAEAGCLHAVRWDVCELDPTKALRAVRNGSILLYHANPQDVECLTALIPALLDAGYEPVTVSTLLGLPEPEISEKADDSAA